MPTRKAVLIGNGGKSGQSGYLPGVEIDLKNYEAFLKHGVGGSWLGQEIDILNNATAAQISTYISNLKSDYIFVAYSGHGGFKRTTGNTFLYIDNQYHPDSILINQNCKWQSIVVDTCRTLIEERKDQTRNFSESFALENLTQIPNTRSFFDDHLNKCEYGKIKVYSAGIGEAAEEDPNKGGLFTHEFIETGTTFGKATSLGKVLDISDAFWSTKLKVQKRTYNRQNPEILTGRRMNNFPFAVGINRGPFS